MLEWSSERLEGEATLSYIAGRTYNNTVQESGDFKANLTRSVSTNTLYLRNLTSTLFITDNNANETQLSCAGIGTEPESVTICITGMYNECLSMILLFWDVHIYLLYNTLGNASPPTNLSVECSASSAVVSFQPPVYGAECVDHYIITAVSEERNITCVIPSNWTLNTFTCNISDTTNVNDYNFTVYGVTNGVDDVIYIGNTTHDCCKLILFSTLQVKG